MTLEQRNYERIQTHILSKLIESETDENHQGYVVNLGLGGVGVVSPDYLPPYSQMICQFCLGDSVHLVNVRASLIHTRKDFGTVYYYGLKFLLLSQQQQQTITNYIRNVSIVPSPV